MIGLRSGEGGSAVVAVAGDAGDPIVVARARVQVRDPDLYGEPYHAASTEPPNRAAEIIRAATKSARRRARDAVKEFVTELTEYEPVAAAVLLGSWQPTPAQARTQHAAMHAAEGELSREALARAADSLGVEVHGYREKDLTHHAVEVLGLASDELAARLTAMGKPMGPPWKKAEKQAALAAWITLAVEPQA